MKPHHWIPALLLASLTAACAGGGDNCVPNTTQACLGPGGCDGVQTCIDGEGFSVCDCGGGGDTDGGVPDETDGGAPAPQAPRIISLTTNVTTLYRGDELTVSAIVTDPDGIDDLIGGRLEHPGAGTYGTFVTAAQEGAYNLTLTWEQINAVAPLEAAPGGSQRSFRARFYDQAGHETTDELSITIRCYGDAAVCSGYCVDLQTEVNSCGSCGFSCDRDVGLDDECPPGQCPRACVDGSCRIRRTFYSQDVATFDTCASLCASIGFECTSASWISWCCEETCPAESCTASPGSTSQDCSIEAADCACETWVTGP